MRVLIAEDDDKLRRGLEDSLKRAGYAVDAVPDGIEAQFMGDEVSYDAVVLDLGLPGRPGLEVLQHWRKKQNSTPVLILTARGAWHEKVEGFKAGADDYLAKPFHFEELLARLQALIRRSKGQASAAIESHGLILDEDKQTVTMHGKELDLTGTEFRLLRYFMLHAGKVLSKTRLAEHVYDDQTDLDSNIMEVYVNRLRHIIGKEKIVTRRGQGYIFGERD